MMLTKSQTPSNVSAPLASRVKLGQVWAYVFTCMMLVFTLFPIYWVFTLSIKSELDGMAIEPMFIFQPTFEHYLKLADKTVFMESFGNSIWITIIATLLSLSIAIPAAYALSRIQKSPRKLVGLWLLLAYMLPEFLFVIPMYTFYQTAGLYDTHFGVALLYQAHVLPFSIWMLRSFFDEVPKAIEEAALMEGCSRLRVLLSIYVPVALPGIIATAILNGIWIWNELAIALGLTFSEAQTVTVGITSFRGYASFDWGGMTAASICAITPMLLAAIFAQKHIVKGMTLGAVKG